MHDALQESETDEEPADGGRSPPPTAGTVPAPLRDDDALVAAVATALDRAEAGDGTVSWADVSDTVPAEQWGRLLETELLVPTERGFVVDDPDAVRAALAAREDPVPDPESAAAGGTGAAGDDGRGWSTADKLAGVGALGLLASYQVPVARDAIGSSVHAVLGPVEAVLPFGATIALLAVLTTVVSTTLRSRLTDGGRREAVRDRMEAVSEQLKRARKRGDDAAVERLRSRQRELMGEQLGALKRMVRPLVWTMLVTVPVFLWLTWLTVNPAAAITPAAQVLPLAGRVVWTARLVGPMQVWMVWYFVCSVVSNIAGKRVAKRTRPVVSQYRSVV